MYNDYCTIMIFFIHLQGTVAVNLVNPPITQD